ncbi:gag-protease polyprotein [Cucumis melo var. makuwa]|uniref:Gag-protease polyprotein n=1 Tax=Cucumis melo var. makuwa TaxID=1194695 RepID=A0A5A7V8U5_CUCMM|nr:gag-protease polyprotein [Cucumis melo var. makuwa]
MTMEQYDAEFDMLSRFAPDVIRDEAAKTEKFVRGLRLDIRGLAREVAREKPLCATCGKYHLGRCLFRTRTCFKRSQEGHTADRCPMRLTGVTQNQGASAP